MNTTPPASDGPQGTIVAAARSARPIDPGVTIGHVHLRTADIDRVRALLRRRPRLRRHHRGARRARLGTTGDLLFVSAGGYHHHLGFNTWKSAGGGPQPDGVAGLHHVAIRYPTRAGLADALRRLRAADWPIRQATDHGTHEAIYLTTPTATTSSSAATARPSSGRGTGRATWRSPTATSTSIIS